LKFVEIQDILLSMGNICEEYPHLITDGAVVDQVQHLLSW